MNEVIRAAQDAYRAGLSVIPIREDGTKAPAVRWKPYQTERADNEQMRRWFRDTERQGLGLVCGYNDLECMEFERFVTYEAFRDTADAAGLGEIVQRIEAGYVEETPGGGIHWLYYCDAVSGSVELASLPSDKVQENEKAVLIETRGMGGFVVVQPSAGSVHETRRPYVLRTGGFDRIARITAEEREALFELARAFDESEKQPYGGRNDAEYYENNYSDQERPGDAYNASGPPWADILNGWSLVYQRGETQFWRRPGKPIGISATINGPGVGPDRLYVFTTSTDFEANRSYTKFQAYTVIEHQGDFRAAAKALARQGYGAADHGITFIYTNGKRTEPITTTRKTYPLTDTGNAERLVAKFGERIRYITAWDRWIVFDGKHWKQDDTRQLERMAKQIAREIDADAEDEPDEKFKGVMKAHARRSESTHGKRAMIVSAEAEPGIVLDHELLDTDPWLLNTGSGTVDLRSGELRAHRKADYLSKMIVHPVGEPQGAPTFLAFLERIFDGDAALIQFIQRAIGYSFTGSTEEQVLFIMHGAGANGKSTFLNILMEAAGTYGRTTPAETLYERKPDAIPNDLAALRGARFVSAFETEDRRSLSEGRVKQMTGGDRMAARFMRGEWFEFEPQFKVWLATNHKPEIRGTDHAIWRRIRLIPFDVTIPEHERDPQLIQKLRQEIPGILRWVIDGAKAWHAEGLGVPDAVRQATLEYQGEADVVGMWIEERCEVSLDAQERSSKLYADYVDWCRDIGQRAMSQTRFGTELISRGGLGKHKSHGAMMISGIHLKPVGGIVFSRNGEGS